MTPPVILFEFAGRRGNLELQLPLFRHILDCNPQVEIHIWNLARDQRDADYLHQIDQPGIEVFHQFAGPRAVHRLSRVWRYYTQAEYRDHLFVKVDDDVVFLQADRFAHFLAAVEGVKNGIVSALTVNNGASTPLLPELWRQFQTLNIPLLDVHMSNAFAEMAHDFMAEHWRELVAAAPAPIPTEDWLSINCIGMNWSTLAELTFRIGHLSPEVIAGRHWHRHQRIGDEGAANLKPRYIMAGFVAAHLGFGPQKITHQQEDRWRRRYRQINAEYLAGVRRSTPHPV